MKWAILLLGLGSGCSAWSGIGLGIDSVTITELESLEPLPAWTTMSIDGVSARTADGFGLAHALVRAEHYSEPDDDDLIDSAAEGLGRLFVVGLEALTDCVFR